jgi:pimeloyl-ACP methyl ester carboxylesterase
MSIPVNIVAGDYDPAASRVALDRVRKSRPDAALDIIRDARHFSSEVTGTDSSRHNAAARFLVVTGRR